MNAAEKPAVKRPWLRFSLKTLLLAVPVVAVLLWWWDSPRRTAREFADTINRGEYAAAETMVTPDGDDLLSEWLIHSGYSPIEMTADVRNPGWRGFLKRKVLIRVQVKIGESPYENTYLATPNGIERESVTIVGPEVTIPADPSLDNYYQDLIADPLQ